MSISMPPRLPTDVFHWQKVSISFVEFKLIKCRWLSIIEHAVLWIASNDKTHSCCHTCVTVIQGGSHETKNSYFKTNFRRRSFESWWFVCSGPVLNFQTIETHMRKHQRWKAWRRWEPKRNTSFVLSYSLRVLSGFSANHHLASGQNGFSQKFPELLFSTTHVNARNSRCVRSYSGYRRVFDSWVDNQHEQKIGVLLT